MKWLAVSQAVNRRSHVYIADQNHKIGNVEAGLASLGDDFPEIGSDIVTSITREAGTDSPVVTPRIQEGRGRRAMAAALNTKDANGMTMDIYKIVEMQSRLKTIKSQLLANRMSKEDMKKFHGGNMDKPQVEAWDKTIDEMIAMVDIARKDYLQLPKGVAELMKKETPPTPSLMAL